MRFPGTRDGDGNLVPTFMMEWKRGSASFKKSIKMMQKINCAHPSVVQNNPVDPVTGRRKTSLTKTSSKDRQFVRKNSEEGDDESIEKTKHRTTESPPPPPPPKIQFDLSENFRREMELHNIAAEQEKAREEQMRQRKRKDGNRRRKDRRGRPTETTRTEDDEQTGTWNFSALT